MAKRYIDTDIFKKPFIRELEPKYKLLWVYLLTNCDHAGIWDVELDVASVRLGIEFKKSEVLETFKDKIDVIDGGDKWFFRSFLFFQYGVLKPENRAHLSAINILKKYNLLDDKLSLLQDPYKTLIRPSRGYKDKDKYKDKVKDLEEKGGMGGKTKVVDMPAPPIRSLPTLDQVVEHFSMKLYQKDKSVAEGFFNHYDAVGWVTGTGVPIVNWRSKAAVWDREQKDKKKKVKTNSSEKYR